MRKPLLRVLPLLVIVGFSANLPLVADNESLPGAGYTPQRYESLSTHSPFAVATPEASPSSAEYGLVGVARSGGIEYASVVNKQSNERILIWKGKNTLIGGTIPPLTLISIHIGKIGDEASAVVKYNGAVMTLKVSKPTMKGGSALAEDSSSQSEPPPEAHFSGGQPIVLRLTPR